MDKRNLVWLASYPKSGNTWVRLMLGHLTGLSENGGEEDDDFSPVLGISSSRTIFEHFVGINSTELTDEEVDTARASVYRELASHSDDIRFIKVHDAFQTTSDGDPFFPGDCSRGAVYLVRDPLDVAVSFSHHQGGRSLEKVVEMMNDRNRWLGGAGKDQLRQHLLDWSGHYRSWVDQTSMPVCVVRYEDLLEDAPGELRRIADFIDLKPSQCAMSIAQAVEAASFEKLQQIETTKGFREKPVRAERFFRSGRAGEGREALDESLQAALIENHGDAMRELGYL